jgi:hypothetical protein
MSDLNNILSSGTEPNDDSLKKYLKGIASDEERFAIENQMADEAFMNDAIEGLQHFKDQQVLEQYVLQLNKDLQKQTDLKKSRKLKRKLKDQNWTILAIIALLVLCTLAYAVIRMYHH